MLVDRPETNELVVIVFAFTQPGEVFFLYVEFLANEKGNRPGRLKLSELYQEMATLSLHTRGFELNFPVITICIECCIPT
jgi:hypothetical protein